MIGFMFKRDLAYASNYIMFYAGHSISPCSHKASLTGITAPYVWRHIRKIQKPVPVVVGHTLCTLEIPLITDNAINRKVGGISETNVQDGNQ
jgi:hypothetical protein